jgi:hypothetical protein
MPNVELIAITDVRAACKDEPDLEQRVRKAMRQAHTFWLSTDDQLRFRAAVAAAVMESPPSEATAIMESLGALQLMAGAMETGDLEAVERHAALSIRLPLLKMWRESANLT